MTRQLLHKRCDNRSGLISIFAISLLLLSSSSAKADNRYWIGYTGDWSTPAYWGGVEPTENDDAYIASNGKVTVTDWDNQCNNLYLSYFSNVDAGTIQMPDGLLSVNSASIGYFGTGVFNQSGGENYVNNDLYVGREYTAIGSFNQSGGLNYVYHALYIGYEYTSTGTFNQSGGNNEIANNLYIGYGATTSGTYYLSDLAGSGNTILSSLYLYIGDSGTGTFNHSGGDHSNHLMYLGDKPYSTGKYNLSGTGTIESYAENIGYEGIGIFTQSGGTNNVSKGGASALWIGNDIGGNGTYNLNGGTLILKALKKGNGTATFNFGGGTLQANGNFVTTLPMTLTGTGGNANIDTVNYTVKLSGVLSGTGGLNKMGSGTLTLNALNSYSGDTNVNGGILEIVDGIDPSGTSHIDVQSGIAALKTVSVNKTNLNINTASLATFEIVNGAHTVGVISGNGTTLVDSDASLTAASISQNTLTIGSGAMVTIQPIPGDPQGGTITSVPEPSTLVLLGMGILVLFGYAWRRRSL